MNTKASITQKSNSNADVLLVVPPFAALDMPSLAVHVLQACCKVKGIKVDVLYANLIWASIIGENLYNSIARGSPYNGFAGEALFSHLIFDVKNKNVSLLENDTFRSRTRRFLTGFEIDLSKYSSAINFAVEWQCKVLEHFKKSRYETVGVTTSFEQTMSGVSILKALKEYDSSVTTVIGGANCKGVMADGMIAIPEFDRVIDYVFEGECENSFVEYLSNAKNDVFPTEKVIAGTACMDMSSLPDPEFEEFFEQRNQYLPNSKLDIAEAWVPYESSRGCWWGEKHHCKFCGFNGTAMMFRDKSPEQFVAQLQRLSNRYPTKRIMMADNILPNRYFQTVLPHLKKVIPDHFIFYEVKANLSLARCVSLKEAGISVVQAGIEGLSTSLLARMDKGVKGYQNIATLRYARSVKLSVSWNILYDFPGDIEEEYVETLRLIPLVCHLQPPTSFSPLTIDRFSPYYEDAESYGVSDLRPINGFTELFPEDYDLQKITYHHRGSYESFGRSGSALVSEVETAVCEWQDLWYRDSGKPRLSIEHRGLNRYVVTDTRSMLGKSKQYEIDEKEAFTILRKRKASGSNVEAWALRNNLIVELDGFLIPLAVAHPSLIEKAERRDLTEKGLIATTADGVACG